MEFNKIVCIPRELNTLQAEVLLGAQVSRHRVRRLRQDLKNNKEIEVTEVGFALVGAERHVKLWIYLGVCTCEQHRAFALCAFQQSIKECLGLRCEIDASNAVVRS